MDLIWIFQFFIILYIWLFTFLYNQKNIWETFYIIKYDYSLAKNTFIYLFLYSGREVINLVEMWRIVQTQTVCNEAQRRMPAKQRERDREDLPFRLRQLTTVVTDDSLSTS